jgi:hypothetical protein
MTEQFSEIQTLLTTMVTDMLSATIAFLPKLVGAAFVLLIGWAIARLVRSVLERALRAGLDSLLERAGVMQTLEESAISTTPSEILGRVAYWLLMILFVMGASEIIGLTAVSAAITRIFGYIPNVISAALILAAGVFLARFASNVVRPTCRTQRAWVRSPIPASWSWWAW